jgi:hypothetical protein
MRAGLMAIPIVHTLAIVGDLQSQLRVALPQRHMHGRRLGMANDVRQRFLQHPEHGQRTALVDIQTLFKVPIANEIGAFDKLPEMCLYCHRQSQGFQRGRTRLYYEPLGTRHRRVDGYTDLVQVIDEFPGIVVPLRVLAS